MRIQSDAQLFNTARYVYERFAAVGRGHDILRLLRLQLLALRKDAIEEAAVVAEVRASLEYLDKML
jgi:hypothetical protein